jgi:hypothetical protein
MSSGNSESIVDLPLSPSIRAMTWGLWAHALPAVVLPLTLSQVHWLLLGAGLVALSWILFRHHPALGARPRSINRIQLNARDEWQIWLKRAPKQGLRVRLRDESILHPRWLWLRFVDEGGVAYSRLLLGDEASSAGLRRLRSRLAVRQHR